MPALSTALPLRSYLTARNIIITTVAGLALILFLSSSSSTSAAAGIVKSSALRTIYSPSQAKQAFILAKQQLQDLSTASAGGRNRFNPTVARSVFDLADQSFVDTTQKKYPCPANLMDVIADAADPTPVNRKNPSPQLNLEQLTWIANTVRTSAYLRNGQANNFLVHGLGHDSLIWRSANCLPTNPNGRTLFTENWPDWIETVTTELPFVDVQFIKYNTTVDEAEADISDHTRMDPAPEALSERCWDVTLIDAPQGYEAKLPGRVAPSWWAVENAEKCLMSGAREAVFVFLHDINRPVEKAIVSRIFGPRAIHLGYYRGFAGHLTGWVLTKDTVSKARLHT